MGFRIEVTVAELIEAAEKNGYPWGGAYHGRDISHLCVLEQAAVNLGAHKSRWTYIADALDRLDWDRKAGQTIYKYNDTHATSYQDAIRAMKEVLVAYGDQTISFYR